MKLLSVVFFIMCFVVTDVWAGSFKGVQPGSSTYEVAVELLGEPTQEVVKNTRYTFESGNDDLSLLSIVVNAESRIVEKVELYPDAETKRDEYRSWFGLAEEPFSSKIDKGGELVEYFWPQAVSLHFTGETSESKVSFISLLPDDYFSDIVDIVQYEKPYLGLSLIQHEGKGFKVYAVDEVSPAQVAGINADDVIVAVNKEKFDEKNISPSVFIAVVNSFSPGKKAVFSVLRMDEGVPVIIKKKVKFISLPEAERRENAIKAINVFEHGQSLLLAGQLYDAVDLFKSAIWLNPYEAIFYTALGNAYTEIGLLDFAMDEFKRAIKLSPDVLAYQGLGTLYLRKEMFEEAAEAFRKVYALEPQNIEAKLLRAESLYSLKRYDEAVKLYEQARGAVVMAAPIMYRLAECYAALEKVEEAIDAYNLYLESPGIPDVLKDSAEAYIEENGAEIV